MDLLVEQMNELQNQLNYFQGKIAILKNIADRDVYGRDSQGDTQLHLVLQNLQVNENVIKQLVDMGAPVNATNYSGQSPLQYALKYKNCDLCIVRLLVDRGADIKLVDHFGLAPLFYAVENKDCPLDVIEFLLGKGADVQVIDKSGFSLLHHALMHKFSSFDVIQLLLDKGVDLHAVNIYGETALHVAVRFNRTDVIKVLLKKPKIKINLADKKRYTPLHRAICSSESDPRIVKLLLEAGANVQKKTKFDEQSLHLAAYHCNPAIIQLLLDYEARINTLDKYGQTPLYIAVQQCASYNRAAVKLLLDAGALVFCDHPMRKIYPRLDCPFDYNSPVHIAADKYNREQNADNLQRVQLLMKYALLERPSLRCHAFNIDEQARHTMCLFLDKCLNEVQSVCAKPNITLAAFILRLRLQEDGEDQTDQILDILAANAYTLYKEVVAGLLTRQELKIGFQRHIVYTETNSTKQACPSKHIVLNYDSLCSVMKYLFDKDLLNLLLAFYNSNKKVASTINCRKLSVASLDEIEFESERFFKRARIN